MDDDRPSTGAERLSKRAAGHESCDRVQQRGEKREDVQTAGRHVFVRQMPISTCRSRAERLKPRGCMCMRHGTIPTIYDCYEDDCLEVFEVQVRQTGRNPRAQKPHMASICQTATSSESALVWTEPARELGAARLVRDVGRQADDREYLRLLHGVFWA